MNVMNIGGMVAPAPPEPLNVEVPKTLNKIIKNAAKKDVDVKANAQKALDVLKDFPLKDPEAETQSTTYEHNINTLITPLLQTCEPQNKLVKPTIAVLQRLVAAGFIRPIAPPPDANAPAQLPRVASSVALNDSSKQLIGKIVDRACKCVESDESTQITIVKFLETCCTVPTLNIHGTTLLAAIKCCFQLFIQAKPKTQLFAAVKKSITDIINFLFQRIKTTKKHVRNSLSISNMNELLQHQQQLLQEQQQQAQLAVKHDGRPDKFRIVSDILNDIIDSVVGSDVAISGPGKVGIIVEDITFSDFCMVFVYVCQVSTEQPKGNVRELHGKLLALQILHTMISNSATTLRSSKKFVTDILRDSLVPALIGNAGATGKVFQYVLSIFTDLLQHFREYLMGELGSFIIKSLLPRMEGSATQELYWILAIFTTICKDGHVLLDLFVNYDCDPELENVYQRCVEALCKAACHPLASGQRFISSQNYQDFQIRGVGLKSIVQLTKTLGEWRDSEKGVQSLSHITEMREKKKKVEHAKHIFSESAKKGIELFVALGATTKDPGELGRFLRNYRGIDKTQIGDFISRKENPAVLEAYVETFDFANMEFDLALRFYLTTFKLPGESMLIERLVQQFANKFYADNKGSHFANADSAFILAYSTIMLATDQHNTNVKVRMTFAQWAKNNSKINDGKDFDEPYLQGIFERISKTPLKLNDSTPTPAAAAEETPKQTHNMPYSTCYRQSLVKYMMDATWQYIGDALDFFMTNCDEASIIEVCLTGYQNSVHLSGIFEIEAARAKFIGSVVKFAKIDNLREISRKEVESIRELAIIFLFEGEHLGVDWVQVLRCISYLAMLFKLGTVSEIIDPVIEPNVLQTQKNDLAALKDSRQLPELPKDTISFDATNVAALARQITVNSTLLSEEQLLLFVDALCKVSHDEIFGGATPNVFGLQLLTDVAYYNLCTHSGAMWSRLWVHISTNHFIKVGTSEYSLAIRKGSLDAMEYLLSHFFTKDPEVTEVFYKDLFFPFDRVIRLCNDHTTRSLILQYVAQLVGNNSAKIRTGWKTIFSIYTWSANCNEVLVEMGLATVEDILREYFQHFATSFFVEFVNCVSAFANAKLPNISIRAIDGISACAVHLANGRVFPPTPVPKEPSLRTSDQSNTQLMFTDEQEHLVLWIPVLTALSDVLSSHDLHTVRLCSLDTLERVLVLFGSMFSPKLWEMIFRGVLLPIFNNIGYSKGRIRFPEESQDWLSTTCPHAFRLLMDIFTNFLETIEFLSGEILQLIASCILQFDSEELLRLGAQSLLRFTTTNGSKFNSQVWDLVTAKIDNIVSQITADQSEFLLSFSPVNSPTVTSPINLRQSILLKSPPSPLRQSSGSLPAPLSSQPNSTPSPVEMRHKHINLSHSSNVLLPPVATRPKLESHVVALQLVVQIIESVATSHEGYSQMSAQHLRSLADGLEAAYTFCHAVLSRMLAEKAPLESETVETLDSTELLACSCYLKILFLLYNSKDVGNEEVEHLLLKRCYMFFSNYLRKERINARVVVQLLTELKNMNESQFMRHLGIFYEVLIQLMLDENEDVRRALQHVWRRIGSIKGGIRTSMTLLPPSHSHTHPVR